MENTPFKIKWQKAELHVAPSGTSNSLGNLKKGAVVIVTEDSNPYYYKVSLDNGLEGFVYKDAGEKVKGLQPTKLPSLSEMAEISKPSTNGTGPTMDISVEKSTSAANGRRPIGGMGRARNAVPRITESSPPTMARVEGVGPGVNITSAEIAVFDKPGIIGNQVAKLKRGERVRLLDDDGFFYKIQLTTGVTGYIPRYAAEEK